MKLKFHFSRSLDNKEMEEKYNYIKNIIWAIIPARGGSKSVPRKNIKKLGGKPLIAWTIEEAKRSSYIKRVIVTTDDREIAQVAKKFGAEVPFLRPKELAQDFSPSFLAFEHALLWFYKNEGAVPEIIAALNPTSPLRRVEHINRGIEMLLSHPDADSVRSVVETPKHPLKMWRFEGERLMPFMTYPEIPEAFNSARQLLQKKMPVYVNNGAIDIIRSKTILEKHVQGGDIIYGFVMNREDSINIDSPEDFIVAEYLLKKGKQ